MLRFLILAALMLPAAYGQTSSPERLGLFNAGRPTTVKVFVVGNLADIGTDRAKIESAVADRLRAAGLWTDSIAESGGARLYVDIGAIGNGLFTCSYLFLKWATDEFGNSGLMSSSAAAVRHDGYHTAHNRDGTYVEFIILRAVDKFIAAYKRVNGL